MEEKEVGCSPNGMGRIKGREFAYTNIVEHFVVDKAPLVDGRCEVLFPYCGEFVRAVSFSENVTDAWYVMEGYGYRLGDISKNARVPLTIEPFGIPIGIMPAIEHGLAFSYKVLPNIDVQFITMSGSSAQLVCQADATVHGNSVLDGNGYMRLIRISRYVRSISAALSTDNSDLGAGYPYTIVFENKSKEVDRHDQTHLEGYVSSFRGEVYKLLSPPTKVKGKSN
jgi:hypothetical protein